MKKLRYGDTFKSPLIKFDLRMKLSLILFFGSLFTMIAGNGYAQKTNLSFHLEQATVAQALDEIEAISEFRFVYNIKDVDLNRRISLVIKKEKIHNVLQQIFLNTNTNYRVKNKQIILESYPGSSQDPIEVKGTILDNNGNPLQGVTVMIKNTNRGVFTDSEGKYRIVVPNEETKLVFSSIGFESQEITVGDKRTINLQLIESVGQLAEVVLNAGYYNTTERERTGNISRVTAEEIENQPLVSPIQTLQGRMAGVEITPSSSNPGSAPIIRIRGINSLREEGNYPLYIIDGVPISSIPVETYSIIGNYGGAGIDPLSSLNIQNIQSIEVLKDADATAIYGSRGANGVVLITTKQGIKNGSGLEVNVSLGASTIPNRLELLNTEQYLAVRRKAFENDGTELTDLNAYDLLLWDDQKYTDWQEFKYGGTSENLNSNIAFSGGNNNTSYRLGASYFKQGTVYPGDRDYNKITGNISLNHTSDDNKFNLLFTSNYGVDKNNTTSFNVNGIEFLPPNAPDLFNEDGSPNWEDWSVGNLTSPLEGYANTNLITTNNFISNLNLSYNLLYSLTFKINVGYNNYNSKDFSKRPKRSYAPSEYTSNSSFHQSSERTSWIVEPQILFNHDFNKLEMNFIIGATLQESNNESSAFGAEGYASEPLIGNLGAASDILNAQSNSTEYKYAAIFSRLGINWDKKFFLNLTGRRDGSSRFGPNKKIANFGAIGAAWIFSNGNFFRNNLSFLSFGKLRGSYGTTGNDQIGDYGYLDAYEATRGEGGLYPTALANPNFSWEVNKKLETAIEVGFLEDKIMLSASWYKNRSSNQLVGYPLPSIAGFTNVQANLPATVENRGWEFTATTENFNSGGFRWETSLNISFPKNELISYPDIDQSSYSNTYKVGYPLNIDLLYQYSGLDPETGYYTVRDVNEDGRYDYEDEIEIRDRDKMWYGGINNNLGYKNISLQFLWSFVKQNGRSEFVFAGAPSNLPIEAYSSLQENSRYQTISNSTQANRAYQWAINSTFFDDQDASYLRLQTLTLGYELPEKVSAKLGLKNLGFSVHGQNLLTITPFNGIDPDNPYSMTGFQGLRTITGGVHINL